MHENFYGNKLNRLITCRQYLNIHLQMYHKLNAFTRYLLH